MTDLAQREFLAWVPYKGRVLVPSWEAPADQAASQLRNEGFSAERLPEPRSKMATLMASLPAGSLDGIWADDLTRDLKPNEVLRALTLFCRALKPGAPIFISAQVGEGGYPADEWRSLFPQTGFKTERELASGSRLGIVATRVASPGALQVRA